MEKRTRTIIHHARVADTTIFEGDGGSYHSWSSSNFPLLGESKVGAGILLLHPHGFALPHYADSKKIGYVLQGGVGVKLGKGIQIHQPQKYAENYDEFASTLTTAVEFTSLEQVGLSFKHVKLGGNAVFQPVYVTDSVQVAYVIKGSGRVQFAGANGEKLLDATVKAGELFVVPRFVVAIEIADAQGMEYLSVVTSSKPVIWEEDYGQVDFAALEQLENPDLHVDSVRTMNLFRKIKEVLAALDCPKKFNLRDLIKPDADRTELFLSALLNFCIHRDTKMNLLRPMVEDLTLLDEKRQQLESRISLLNAEIAEQNELREREMPLVQDVEAKVKELTQIIPGLNNHQMSLKASIKKMKEKAKEMDEKISSAEFVLVQSVQENASLRSKIVQSPDKLQRALEEKKVVRIDAKNAERAAMLSFQEKSAVLEVYMKASKKLSKNLAQMQAIQEQVNSAKSVEKDVKVLKVKQSEAGMLDKSLEAKLIERQGKVEQLDEMRKQLEKERDLRCEEATKELNNVKSEVEEKRRDLESRQTKLQAVVTEADAMSMKSNSVKESEAAKRQELCRKSEDIVSQFYEYSNSIGGLLPKN